MPLIFNIIYTPGTVHYLTFFVYSLLRWSDCSFRLVANGCSPEEEYALRDFCQQDVRLEFYRLPTKQVLEHGLALNHLQSLTQSAEFCFMDSDIYATGEFISQFLPLRTDHAAVFSCSPVWCKAEDSVQRADNPIIAGEFNCTDNGRCLGNTYFAIYENALLTSFRQKHGIGFDRLTWQQLPRRLQQPLRAHHLQKEYYDTGKVLNLLLQDEGHQLIVREIETLQHLGGVSIVPIQRRDAAKQQQQPWPQTLGQKLLRATAIRLRRIWQPGYYHFTFSKRRAAYKIYFHDLLVALHEHKTPPPLPQIDDPTVEARVEIVRQQIIQLLEQRKSYGDAVAKQWEQVA